MIQRVTVLGAGAWGTALAKSISDAGYATKLWVYERDLVEVIRTTRINRDYLPGFSLSENLTPTNDMREALSDAELIVSVVPTHGLRSTLSAAKGFFADNAVVLSATKGIENGTLKLVSGIFDDQFSASQRKNICYLGGPSFAKEVAAGIPTAVVVAGSDPGVAERIQKVLNTERLRVYTTDDVTGIEVGGSLKNVIAIAAGISDGLGFGANTRAALITRGLAEMTRLATKLGANPLTMAGLGGMGDLVLTCTGDLSRNRSVGLELGKGRKLAEILAGAKTVAEGVGTTKSAYELSQREQVEMPIVEAMYRILYQDQAAMQAVVELMTRKSRAERDQ